MSTHALGLRRVSPVFLPLFIRIEPLRRPAQKSSYLPALHSPLPRSMFVLHVRSITRTHSTLVGFSLDQHSAGCRPTYAHRSLLSFAVKNGWLCYAPYTARGTSRRRARYAFCSGCDFSLLHVRAAELHSAAQTGSSLYPPLNVDRNRTSALAVSSDDTLIKVNTVGVGSPAMA
ncbi:hypothetical protein BKA93DRAFT_146451 [Sparassis latifolia]